MPFSATVRSVEQWNQVADADSSVRRYAKSVLNNLFGYQEDSQHYKDDVEQLARAIYAGRHIVDEKMENEE